MRAEFVWEVLTNPPPIPGKKKKIENGGLLFGNIHQTDDSCSDWLPQNLSGG